MDPVVVTAVFLPLPGRIAELIAAFEATIPAVHAEDGCELYAIHEHPDGSIVMMEKWSSTDLLDAHAASEATSALRAATIPLCVAEPVVTLLRPLPAGTEFQGTL